MGIYKKCVSYLCILTVTFSGLHWAFFFTILGVFYSPYLKAADELKNQLVDKYHLDAPQSGSNHNIYDKAMSIANSVDQSGKDLESQLLNRPQSTGTGNPVDLSKYQQTDFQTEYRKYMDSGLPGIKPATPAMSADGQSINTNYYEKGSAKLKKNSNGKLVIETIPLNERGEHITSTSNSEVFTNQTVNPEVTFNAPDTYGNESAYTDDIKAKYQQVQTGTTKDAEAYQAIIGSRNSNPPPQIKSNAYFLQNGYNNISDAKNGVGIWAQTCTDETKTVTDKKYIPVWEPKICSEPNHQNMDHCEVTRHLETNGDLVKVNASAKFGYSSGTWITIYADFKNGTATITDPSDQKGAAFASEIDKVDYNLFCEKNKGIIQLSSQTTWKNFPAGGSLDNSVNLRELEAPTCANGLVAKLQVEDTNHTGKAKFNVTGIFNYQFQTSPYKEVFTQSPDGCADKVGWTPGPYPCSGDGCYKPKESIDSFCTFDGWELLQQGTQSYPQWVITALQKMFPDDPNPDKLYNTDEDGNPASESYYMASWKINARAYSCDPLKGNKYCAQIYNPETKQYEEQCFTYDELKSNPGSCGQYATNDKCEQVSKSCAEGWYDEQTDICYMYSANYRCDVGHDISTSHTTTTNTCASMLPCLGTDCSYGEEESSTDFEKAVLMASVAQTVDSDGQCETSDPTTCKIFEGEPKYCSWEVTGMGNNCCEAPSGVNYLEMAYASYKFTQTSAFKSITNRVAQTVPGKTIEGLYSDASSMLVNGWNAGSSAVVEYTSSMFGDPEFMSGWADSLKIGSTGGSSLSSAVSAAMYKMQQQVYSWLNSELPSELSAMLFKTAGEDAVKEGAAQQTGDIILSDSMQTFVNVVSFIGTVYTIYTMTKLVINLLTQCDSNEQDMGVRIAERQCFKVDGAYCAKKVLGVCVIRRQNWCCYSSILARIIAKQGSEQLGKDMSQCEGFTVSEFAQIDFDKLDLSEWLATMYDSNLLPTAGYNSELLTGTGRMIGNTGSCQVGDSTCQEMTRKTAEKRAEEEFSTDDISTNANINKETLDPNDVDCSVYPRPLICELQN